MAHKKQYRKQKQRKNFLWLFLTLGGGLLVFAAILFANRGAPGGTPAISVDQDKIDYGYVTFGEPRQITLKVSNTGDGTLRFEEGPSIQVLEGC